MEAFNGGTCGIREKLGSIVCDEGTLKSADLVDVVGERLLGVVKFHRRRPYWSQSCGGGLNGRQG